MEGRGGKLRGFMDQHEIPEVNKGADALTSDKDRVLPVDGIGQRNESSRQTHVPKTDRNAAFRATLGSEPLYDPPHEKDALAEQSDGHPYSLGKLHSRD